MRAFILAGTFSLVCINAVSTYLGNHSGPVPHSDDFAFFIFGRV